MINDIVDKIVVTNIGYIYLLSINEKIITIKNVANDENDKNSEYSNILL